MPSLENAVPKYRKHRASGQVAASLAGRDHYLDRYNTQSSRMLHKRLVGEWLVSGPPIDSTEYESLTITELVGRCWKHAQAFYRRTDGTKTDTADRMRPALRELRSLYADATLAELTPTVSAMVQIQRFTGARPSEICIMRPGNIDKSQDVWLFIPERHKTKHHGKARKIVIGPRAQNILTSFLDRDPNDYCFSAAETNEQHLIVRHAKRKTPLSCGCKPDKRKANRNRASQDHYPNDSYRRAIHRAVIGSLRRHHRWLANPTRRTLPECGG